MNFRCNLPQTNVNDACYLIWMFLTLSLPESNLEPINMVVLFESVDETLVCDDSNESY